MYQSSSKLVKMIVISLLATVSFVLFFISFPILPVPGLHFLKVDLSDIPALIAALIFSPLTGVLVLFLKCLLYLAFKFSPHELIGAPANFIAGTTFILPISIMYHRFKKVNSLIVGIGTGTLLMAIIMTILNFYVVIPAYGWVMGFQIDEQISTLGLVSGLFIFNILKGIIIGIAFVPIFVALRVWIEQKQRQLA